MGDKRNKRQMIADSDSTYAFNVRIEQNCEYKKIRNITGTVALCDEIVGKLQGYLISRGADFLFNCGSISQEIQECSCAFFDNKGRIDEDFRNDFSPACNKGGYLHISNIEIDRGHRHQSLGLRLLSFMFKHSMVNKKWSIAFMYPMLNQIEDFSKADDVKISLGRYFGRIGFRQVPQTKWWFMEPANLLVEDFITKEMSDSVEVFIPRKKIANTTAYMYSRMTNLLQAYASDRSRSCGEYHSILPILQTALDSLIRYGGDINKEPLLQYAVANDLEEVMELLFSRGSLPNHVDELGNSALHLAAIGAPYNDTSKYIDMLVSIGAKKNLKNKDGQTPLQLLKIAFKEQSKLLSSFGLAKSPNADRLMETLISKLKP